MTELIVIYDYDQVLLSLKHNKDSLYQVCTCVLLYVRLFVWRSIAAFNKFSMRHIIYRVLFIDVVLKLKPGKADILKENFA